MEEIESKYFVFENCWVCVHGCYRCGAKPIHGRSYASGSFLAVRACLKLCDCLLGSELGVSLVFLPCRPQRVSCLENKPVPFTVELVQRKGSGDVGVHCSCRPPLLHMKSIYMAGIG
jgi:hypothetical protein